jgi:mono/diheme cytochrome c family protein
MKMTRPGAAIAVLAAGVWGGAIVAQQQRSTTAARVDFRTQIQPLLAERCLECHSQDKRKGGLSLATYADILEGGKDGPVVRPGNAGNSLLLHRVSGEIEPQMPKDELPLAADEIALLRTWIDQGVRATPTAAAAPAPWEAPLPLERPALPPVVSPAWQAPIDRLVSSYLRRRATALAAPVSDAQFARRAYLDVWGLLPTPEQLGTFVADRSPSKRSALVEALLADSEKYADHWISFWNDLLRNEDGVTYFSESAGRRSITDWLLAALRTNVPYDRFVEKLINPTEPTDPEGFLVGVNWRGETSAAVTPWMQASQNTAQVFLGINLKCTSCHDSFVNRWKLKDAYGLAAYFSPEPTLRMYRCDVAQDATTGPGFLFPALARAPGSSSLADRRAAAAAIFTDPRLGRMPRTIVNRVWQRLLGQGIVATPDEMDGEPWSPALLDWLASDFVAHRYDLKHLIASILSSRTYQMPSVPRTAEPPARGYVFGGPEVRRLTAEQFADAVGAITGEWSVAPSRGPSPPAPRVEKGQPLPSQPTSAGVYAREWRAASSNLTRALGRPIRDQITATRPTQATTLQALELTNGAILSRWVSRGARRMLGELPADPTSLYNRAVAGRNASPSRFEIDVSRSSRLWLIVEETGSNVPEAILPAWAQAELVGPAGVTPLSALTPSDRAGLRTGSGPIRVGAPSDDAGGEGVRVKNPSVLVYDIGGRGFTTFRGVIGIENKASDIGSTLNPSTRFHVFDVEPDMERLVPPLPGAPLPRAEPVTTIGAAIDRLFTHALGRAPTPAERRIAGAALRAPGRGDKPSAEGLADLLWAMLMQPEFQLIY